MRDCGLTPAITCSVWFDSSIRAAWVEWNWSLSFGDSQREELEVFQNVGGKVGYVAELSFRMTRSQPIG